VLLHGAGAVGPQALRAHVRGERLRDALVVEVGPSGAGTPVRSGGHIGRVRGLAVGADDPTAATADPAVMAAVLDLALAELRPA
jgi:hypothetical protein